MGKSCYVRICAFLENSGGLPRWKGHEKWERKGQEVRVLRGWEVREIQ